jgi:negative regulator of flagellin synthesis FlgM
MQIYGPTHLHGAQPLNAPHGIRSSQPATRSEAAQPSDSVEISSAGRLAEQMSQIPDIRQNRVNEIRSQIAAGTYETDAKLSTALNRLLDEIG